jgi:hypothetical protein
MPGQGGLTTRSRIKERLEMAQKTSRAGIARKGKASVASGQWAGDIGSFVDWCAAASDLDAYRAALAEVPPNSAWDAVSRSLRAEIEYQARPSDSGTRLRAPTVFRDIDPEGEELRTAKRRILEAEITRRAVR